MCEQDTVCCKVTQFINVVTVPNCATHFTIAVKFCHAYLRLCSTDVAEISFLSQLETYYMGKQSMTHRLMGVWMVLVICSYTAAHVREHERPGDDGRSETEGSDAEDGDDPAQWYEHGLVRFI